MLNGVAPSSHVFEGIKALTAECDLSFGNLEIPLTSSRTRTARKSTGELTKRSQFILKADPRHAEFLQQSGISIVTLANNHSMDYGPTGLGEMKSLLDQYKILHAGAGPNANEALRPAIARLPNQKSVALISVLGFMTTSALRKTTPAALEEPGVAALNLYGSLGKKSQEKLARLIKLGHDKADYVVVGIHWGVERKPIPTPYQVELGRALVDAGADVVWGNHPHVLQGAEMYRGHLIMYSMGNLISSLPASTGFFKLQIADDGTQSAKFFPAKVAGGRVSLVESIQSARSIKTMKSLCRLLLRHYPSTVSVPAL